MSNLIFDSVTKIFGKGSSKYVALENINFEAESGQLILVVGPSGSGKTTFLTIAGGLQTPTNGDVKINDSTINSLSKKQQTKLRLEKIGFILQSYNLVPFLTVEEQFKFVDKLKKQNLTEQKLHELLSDLGLIELLKKYPNQLSGGQKRRCEIAAALLNDPEVLFLDEPTTGLDPATRKQVWNSVESLQCEDQVTVFLTTHYMEEAAAAGHIVILDKGKICEFGTPQELKMRYAKDMLTLYYKQEKDTLTSDNEKIYDTIPITAKSEIRVLENSMEAIPILNQLSDQLEGFELQQGTMDDVFLAVTGKRLKGGNI